MSHRQAGLDSNNVGIKETTKYSWNKLVCFKMHQPNFFAKTDCEQNLVMDRVRQNDIQ